MSQSILSRAPARSVFNATLGALAVLVMTSVHHVYGAILFETPWRLHIVFISIPVAIVMLGAIPLARGSNSWTSHLASWVFLLLAGGFAVLMIGVYEGGYNHLIPNIQYVLGIEHPLRADLYLPPDDLIFQLTGIAQFVVALFAGWSLWRVVFPPRPHTDAMVPDLNR